MKYKSARKKQRTLPQTLIFGMVFSTLAFFLLALLASFILSGFKNPLAASGIASFSVLLIAGAISGFCTAKYKGERAVLAAGLSSIIFSLLIFGVGIIMCHGKAASLTAINLLCYVALSFMSAGFAMREKKRRARR